MFLKVYHGLFFKRKRKEEKNLLRNNWQFCTDARPLERSAGGAHREKKPTWAPFYQTMHLVGKKYKLTIRENQLIIWIDMSWPCLFYQTIVLVETNRSTHLGYLSQSGGNHCDIFHWSDYIVSSQSQSFWFLRCLEGYLSISQFGITIS